MEDKPIVFKDYARMLWKYSFVIVLITGLFTAASAYMSYYVIKPTYQAKAEILINDINDEGQLVNLDNQFKLIGTYIEILKSPRIIDAVEQEIANNGIKENLDKKVQIANEEDTQVIKIIVENESPENAAQIANTYANYFQKEVLEVMKTDNVQILSEAKSINIPVKPKPFLNISIAFALGLMISLLLIFLLGNPNKKTKKQK